MLDMTVFLSTIAGVGVFYLVGSGVIYTLMTIRRRGVEKRLSEFHELLEELSKHADVTVITPDDDGEDVKVNHVKKSSKNDTKH